MAGLVWPSDGRHLFKQLLSFPVGGRGLPGVSLRPEHDGGWRCPVDYLSLDVVRISDGADRGRRPQGGSDTQACKSSDYVGHRLRIRGIADDQGFRFGLQNPKHHRNRYSGKHDGELLACDRAGLWDQPVHIGPDGPYIFRSGDWTTETCSGRCDRLLLQQYSIIDFTMGSVTARMAGSSPPETATQCMYSERRIRGMQHTRHMEGRRLPKSFHRILGAWNSTLLFHQRLWPKRRPTDRHSTN